MKNMVSTLSLNLWKVGIDLDNFAIILWLNYTCNTAVGKFNPGHPFIEDSAPFYFVKKPGPEDPALGYPWKGIVFP
jgi:hypothetical protein